MDFMHCTGSTHVAVARAGGIDLLAPTSGALQGCLAAEGLDGREPAGVSLLPSSTARYRSLIFADDARLGVNWEI